MASLQFVHIIDDVAGLHAASRWRLVGFIALSLSVHVAVLSLLQGSRSSPSTLRVPHLEVRFDTTPPASDHFSVDSELISLRSEPKRRLNTPIVRENPVTFVREEPAAIEPDTLKKSESSLASPPFNKIEEHHAEVALFDNAHYLPVTMLDRYPTLDASLSVIALHNGDIAATEGHVRLSLWIDEHGVVTKAEVIEAEPEGVFDDVVLHAYRTAVFLPGERDGIPVKSKLIVEVDFGKATDPEVSPHF